MVSAGTLYRSLRVGLVNVNLTSHDIIVIQSAILTSFPVPLLRSYEVIVANELRCILHIPGTDTHTTSSPSDQYRLLCLFTSTFSRLLPRV